MMTIPNLLSFVRIPIAFLFLQENVALRILAIFIAMITDALDGFIARRYNQTSKLGRILDPITDKFFVLFVLVVLYQENRIQFWETLTFFSRDVAVFIFGTYLILSDKLKKYSYKPFWCGKITTTLQFILLLGLTLKYSFPPYFYGAFIVLGVVSLLELFLDKKK